MADYLIFEENTGHYVLTDEAVQSELGVDLGASLNTSGDINPASVGERFRKRISMMIYNFIGTYGPDENFVNAKIACSDTNKRAFTNALLQQTLYVINNGDIGIQAGINLRDGRAMKLEELRGLSRICDDAYQILLRHDFLYCGVSRGWGNNL